MKPEDYKVLQILTQEVSNSIADVTNALRMVREETMQTSELAHETATNSEINGQTLKSHSSRLNDVESQILEIGKELTELKEILTMIYNTQLKHESIINMATGIDSTNIAKPSENKPLPKPEKMQETDETDDLAKTLLEDINVMRHSTSKKEEMKKATKHPSQVLKKPQVEKKKEEIKEARKIYTEEELRAMGWKRIKRLALKTFGCTNVTEDRDFYVKFILHQQKVRAGG